MKRVLVVIMILAFAVQVVTAGLISFGFGAHALNTIPVVDDVVDMGTADDWKLGAEMRLGVLFLDAGINGQFTTSDRFDGLVTFGTSLSIFDLLHLGVGAGPAFALAKTEAGEIGWIQIDEDGVSHNSNDFAQVFNEGLIHYRVHGDLKLGRFSLGVTYQVPSMGYTLQNEKVLGLRPDWDQALIGTSLLFWLF